MTNSRHGAGMHDAPVVHDEHIVAERRGRIEILLDQQDRLAGCLQSLEGLDHGAHHDGREALGRLVDQQEAARLGDGAGNGEHLLLPA